MVQWLIIHLYIHHTSVLKYLKQYKLTFFFFKLTLHIGTCKAALSIHVEKCSDCRVLSPTMNSTSPERDCGVANLNRPRPNCHTEHEGLLFYKVYRKFNSEDFRKHLSFI